jgi:hypothetical protein
LDKEEGGGELVVIAREGKKEGQREERETDDLATRKGETGGKRV